MKTMRLMGRMGRMGVMACGLGLVLWAGTALGVSTNGTARIILPLRTDAGVPSGRAITVSPTYNPLTDMTNWNWGAPLVFYSTNTVTGWSTNCAVMDLVPNQYTLSVSGVGGSATITVATNNVGATNWATALTTNLLTATWAGVTTVVTNTYTITNQAAWSSPTNAGGRTVNLAVACQDFTTNAAFSFAGCTGVTLTDYRSSVVLVSNSSGSTFIISAPAGCRTFGTANVTNVTVCSFFCNAGRWTNMVVQPLW